MCLCNSHLIPKLALRDIPVKKMFVIAGNMLVTPFMFCTVDTTTLIPNCNSIKTTCNDIWQRHIGAGFIHSYTQYHDDYIGFRYLIMKAVIPRGSWYYTEKARGVITEYASTKLILKPTEEQKKYFKK